MIFLDFSFQRLRNNRLLARFFLHIFIIDIIIKILFHLLQINILFILIINYTVFAYHLPFRRNLGVEYLLLIKIINITLLDLFA